jgi:hypothetical protein
MERGLRRADGYLRLHGALLVRLAQALDTTPDKILGAAPAAPATDEPPLDPPSAPRAG